MPLKHPHYGTLHLRAVAMVFPWPEDESRCGKAPSDLRQKAFSHRAHCPEKEEEGSCAADRPRDASRVAPRPQDAAPRLTSGYSRRERESPPVAGGDFCKGKAQAAGKGQRQPAQER